jgi:heme-degrading monooxygenase HmoA
MEVVLFHIRTRPDVDETEYGRAFEHMVTLVSEMPGFSCLEGFSGEDGRELAVARFESEDAIAAWRDHPEHVRTRQRGREEFFAEYDITIATVSRHYSWTSEAIPSTTPEGEVATPPGEQGLATRHDGHARSGRPLGGTR